MKITTEEINSDFNPLQVNITLESQQEFDLFFAIFNNGNVYSDISMHKSLPTDSATKGFSHSHITQLFEDFTTKIFKALQHYVI